MNEDSVIQGFKAPSMGNRISAVRGDILPLSTYKEKSFF